VIIDDRIIWTDRAEVEWTGHYRGEWQGFAEIVLDAIQAHGRTPVALRIKVCPDRVRHATGPTPDPR
jgi:hypothetical protein